MSTLEAVNVKGSDESGNSTTNGSHPLNMKIREINLAVEGEDGKLMNANKNLSKSMYLIGVFICIYKYFI